MKSNYQSKIIGLLFLIGGVCFLGEQLNLWDFSIFFPGWWTLFLILPAIFSMVEEGVRFGNVCLCAIGGYFLLDANEWISFRLTFGAISAILCILIGVRLIIGNRTRDTHREEKTTHCEDVHMDVVCGTRHYKGGGELHSLDAQCLMGSQFIDLTQADLRNMRSMKLQATMGSIDVVVSADMNYVVKKDSVIGSCTIQDEPIGKYDLYVDVSSVLGSVNLRKKKSVQYREGEFSEK